MRQAYDQCVRQMRGFIYQGNVGWPPDVFTLCRLTGVRDVKRFIRTEQFAWAFIERCFDLVE